MRRHVRHGFDIVGPVRWLADAGDVVRYHHEKYDGSGYDRRLSGRQIPLAARVFAIADVFDALTSQRPYKKPMAVAEALSVLRQSRGSHFDPDLLDKFRAYRGVHLSEANESDERAGKPWKRSWSGTSAAGPDRAGDGRRGAQDLAIALRPLRTMLADPPGRRPRPASCLAGRRAGRRDQVRIRV